ncbi:MAG: HIT domain-containing protein [Armatimonadota bacterium]|nr:HIT domain-containing protein [Armatimonadota bacterium]
MERLWAPWRMQYINSNQTETGCIFCVKPQEDRDEENLILYRGETAFIMMNAFPYNNGHLLITPYRHVADLPLLSDAEQLDLIKLTSFGCELLKSAFHPHGFNVGMNLGQVAGAGIADHMHVHIVPRWSGDTNFMPVISDTKVLPEALSSTYQALKAELAKSR